MAISCKKIEVKQLIGSNNFKFIALIIFARLTKSRANLLKYTKTKKNYPLKREICL